MCAQRARKMYDDAAKERQKEAGGDRKSEKAKSVVDNCTQAINEGRSHPQTPGKSRDAAGKDFGVFLALPPSLWSTVGKGPRMPPVAFCAEKGPIDPQGHRAATRSGLRNGMEAP
jgi:hypothetical protein